MAMIMKIMMAMNEITMRTKMVWATKMKRNDNDNGEDVDDDAYIDIAFWNI